MNNDKVEIFKPGIAELRKLAERYRGLTIKGVDDEEGYQAVKVARKELGDMRILITKYGKSKREEAIAFQKEVIRQEKEHLQVIEPVEDELKARLVEIDETKKREERKILLPSRKKMLEEIELEMTDEDILSLDENAFSVVYNNAKVAYLEKQNQKLLEKQREDARKAEIAQAEERAREEEKQRAEREKQAEIDRINREHEAAERKRIADEEKKKADEEKRKADEAAEIARQEKNRRYKAWLKENGVTEENKADFHIERANEENGSTVFTLYAKVGSIVIR